MLSRLAPEYKMCDVLIWVVPTDRDLNQLFRKSSNWRESSVVSKRISSSFICVDVGSLTRCSTSRWTLKWKGGVLNRECEFDQSSYIIFSTDNQLQLGRAHLEANSKISRELVKINVSRVIRILGIVPSV